MHSLFALAVPLALILPWLGEGDEPAARADAASAPAQCDAGLGEGTSAAGGEVLGLNPLLALRNAGRAQQVRIEQRVVVRISPQSPAARQNLLAELPQRPLAPRFEERGKEKCVPLEGIAGVQTGSGNRLVLFLRDRRMMSVNLGKSCRARDFYSGFYVEKNKDGRLCVERDKLQSRTGVSCEVESMRQLVAVRG